MPASIDRRFYAENEAPPLRRVVGTGCLAFGAFPPLAMLMFWLFRDRFDPPDLLRVTAALWALPFALLGPRLMRGSRRSGVSIDDDGLTEHFALSVGRRVAWAEMLDLHLGFDSAWVDTTQGRIDLGPPLTDWSDLAHRVAERLGRAPIRDGDESADVDVPTGLVAQWLGVGEQRARVCRSPFWPLAWLAQAAILVWGAWNLRGGLDWSWMFRPCLALAVIAMAWTQLHAGWRADRRVRRVVATPEALEVELPGARRRYPWGSVRQVARRGLYWVITTSHGDIWLPPLLAGRRPLLRAVANAIDARRQGMALPRMGGDVPAGAISRVALELDADRGLSRGDEAM